MEKLLISLFELVREFGYIVIPITQINEDIKRELSIKDIENGEIVVASRVFVDDAAKIANKLNVVKTQAIVHQYGAVVIYITKSV